MQQRNHDSSFVLRGTIACLGVLLGVGLVAYGYQTRNGLGVTGMSRDISWGLYIAQFTFLVGIAASSVLVVLPRYAHGKSDLAPLVPVGECVSVSALVAAMTFVLVDLGRPSRVLAVILHPAPSSLMFWDISTLSVYFLLCAAVLTSSLVLPPGSHPAWLRRLALTSVPFAFGIHIVTALLYAGLSARAGWMTAILAPKFLATAFASGSSLLLLMATILSRTGRLHVEPSALTRLATIMTYALCATLLFSALEVFTAVYSGLPSTEQHALHLLVPSEHASAFTALMLVSLGLDGLALVVLLIPAVRRRPFSLTGAGVMIVLATLLEKGLIFIPSGFAPSAFGEYITYHPSIIEVLVVCGVYSGALLIFIALLGPAIAHTREPGADQRRFLDLKGSSSAAVATVGKACAQSSS